VRNGGEAFGGPPKRDSGNNKEQRENRHRIEELVRVAWLFVYVIAAIITYHAYPFISLRSRFKHDYRRDYHDRRDDNYKN